MFFATRPRLASSVFSNATLAETFGRDDLGPRVPGRPATQRWSSDVPSFGRHVEREPPPKSESSSPRGWVAPLVFARPDLAAQVVEGAASLLVTGKGNPAALFGAANALIDLSLTLQRYQRFGIGG